MDFCADDTAGFRKARKIRKNTSKRTAVGLSVFDSPQLRADVRSKQKGANKYIASYDAFENDETDGELTSFEVRQTRFSKGIAEALVTYHAQLLAQLSGKSVEAPDFLEQAKNAN